MPEGGMRKPRWALTGVVIGSLVVIGAMGITTWQALSLERREREAQGQAKFQESLRLALWRIDSAMTPIIAREAARPYFEYRPFYPAPDAFDVNTRQDAGGIVVPSPLLSMDDPLVRLHFEVDESGNVSSPQAPMGGVRDIAEAGYVTAYSIETSLARATELQHRLRSVLLPEQSEAARVGADRERPDTPDAAIGSVDKAEAKMSRAKTSSSLEQSGAPSGSIKRQSSASAAETLSEEIVQRSLNEDVEAPAPQVSDGSVKGGYAPPDDAEYRARADILQRASVNNSTLAAQVATQQSARSNRAAWPESEGAGERLSVRPLADAAAGPSETFATKPADPVELRTKEVAAKDALSRAASAESSPKTVASAPRPPSPFAPVMVTAPIESQIAARARSEILGSRVAEELGAMAESLRIRVPDIEPLPTGLVSQGQFTPRWLAHTTDEPDLLFTREVRVGERVLEQGFWLDWPQLRATLLQPVLTMFPGCTIRPLGASAAPGDGQARLLATIPAELVVAPPAQAHTFTWSPLRTLLAGAWVMVLASVGALFTLARASLELADRRGRFVSAVTHELRTPLTTFSLYSQMLAEGMVHDDEARRTYARTLHGESQRLTRIVESVLDFARLGRTNKPRPERTTIDALRARLEPSFAAVCERAGMSLVATSDADSPLETDPAIVERVLGNLIDNACKYAAGSADNRVLLSWHARYEKEVLIRVRDFGPGIPHAERRKVFGAFVRGEAVAHGGVSGLGLGLALSQAMTRQLGGDLVLADLAPGEAGTLFEVRLPQIARAG
jgi:signal transduction histidine kinase